LGREGVWLVFHFRFDGLEVEERLAHVVLVREDSGFVLLEEDLIPSLLMLKAVQHKDVLPLDPVLAQSQEIQGALAAIEARWATNVRARNEDYYDQEAEKIETYSEEAVARMYAELEQTDKALKDARRRRGTASSFDERQSIRREIHRLEQEFSRQADRVVEEKKRLFEEKGQIMRNLEKRLKLRVERKLIAACNWHLD